MYLQLLLTLAASVSVTAKQYGGLYTCYECLASGCNNPSNQTCDGGISCYISLDLVDKKNVLFRRGCITNEFVRLALCHYRNVTTQVLNCCKGNFCNGLKFPSVPDHWNSSTKVENKQLDKKEINSTHGVSLSILYYVLALVVCFIILYCVFNRAFSSNKMDLTSGCDNPNLLDSFDIPESDSRSYMLTLNQRCMAQDVSLIKLIGKGRFGEVYQGLWHGENVAIKVFSTWDEASWKNEVNIYTNIALYHENVLGFKGSAITTRSGSTEMWILTAYHEQGSLYDYLLKDTITLNEMMEFARCICSGLLHLHTEMFASKGKPAIAHRDLKTRNILLTSHGTCVIADFGLAVVKTDEFLSTKMPNYKVGTKRYMAPEILNDSLNIKTFESFKRTDIYAFGLILWEICSRYNTDGTAEAFHVAFHNCVPNDPSFDDMKKVVCIELKRPEIPASWSSDETLNAMASLMKECWHKNPEFRSTVCRVKKVLDKIKANIQKRQSTAQSD